MKQGRTQTLHKLQIHYSRRTCKLPKYQTMTYRFNVKSLNLPHNITNLFRHAVCVHSSVFWLDVSLSEVKVAKDDKHVVFLQEAADKHNYWINKTFQDLSSFFPPWKSFNKMQVRNLSGLEISYVAVESVFKIKPTTAWFCFQFRALGCSHGKLLIYIKSLTVLHKLWERNITLCL